jgi:type I restriction enzyme S subunit
MNAVLEAHEPSTRYLAALKPALLDQFDLIASAPNGVAHLRELILTLAVQGKLVPQDPNDEPASVLLERIRTEKARLVKEGKFRKEKPLASIREKTSFAIPNGWTETSFASIGCISGGKTPSTHRPEYWGGTIPWVSSKDMKSLWISDTQDHVTQKAVADGLALVPSGAVLIVVRSGILRRTVPVAITSVPCTVNQDIKAMQLALPCMAQYVQLMVRGFERFILENLTKVGTTVESIRFEDLERYPFPLPPLAEQSRIVARVEELMALCDALESKGKLGAEQHARLVGSLFDSLASSESAHALAENWQRIATHFDLLLDRPAAVDALEQTILQLAVRGLLVSQDPSDEPASALLRKIRVEKDRLIATGQLKRDKPLSPISDEEKPFELPEGWEWVRCGEYFQELCTGPFGSVIHKEDYVSDGIPLINPSHMIDGEIIADFDVSVPPEMALRLTAYRLSAGDVVLARRGEMGRFALVTESEDGWLCGTGSFFAKLHVECNRRYLALQLLDPRFRQHLLGQSVGSTMVNMNQRTLLETLVAIPPLAEQSRIVARVAELRALCTQLRERLAATTQTQSRLAETLIETVVA